MSSSVRVSNLPKDATEETIRSLFLSFGNIQNLEKHKGYIDIQFQDIEDAQAAIDNVSGFQLYGRYLHVSKIKEITLTDTLEDKKAIWEQQHELNTTADE